MPQPHVTPALRRALDSHEPLQPLSRFLAESVLATLPEWSDFLAVIRDGSPRAGQRLADGRVCFTVPSPSPECPALVLEADEDFNEASLVYGDWHAHSDSIDAVTAESVSRAVRGLVDDAVEIMAGRSVIVVEWATPGKRQWVGSWISLPSAIVAPKAPHWLQISSWTAPHARIVNGTVPAPAAAPVPLSDTVGAA
jgi:hypothetical protein